MSQDTLPRDIHVETETVTDVVSHTPVTRMVIWADRPYNTCPRCGEPVEQPGLPVRMNPGDGHGCRFEELSQEHHCGEWLSVDWRETTAERLEADAAELAADRAEQIAELRAAVTRRLDRELNAAMARLGEPLDADAGETADGRADEVTTGTEVEPGVCRDGAAWFTWDYDPAGSGDPITVYRAA